MKAAPPALTASALFNAVADRYQPPEWQLESEVTLAGRRLDVVALNMWGTRGYRIVGFEIKVSRGDWLRELAAFQKSEEWMGVVDAFYVVTPPKLVKDDELPIGWGLLELTGNRMMTRRHAEVRKGSTMLPREVVMRFIGRIAERAARADRAAEYKASRELREEVEAQLRTTFDQQRETERAEFKKLREDHARLLDAMGIAKGDYFAHEKAMRAAGVFVQSKGDTSVLRQQLNRNVGAFESLLGRMREAVALLEEGS